jgi:hypothetical protein
VSREQVDIRQLWNIIHEDDIRWPNVSMGEACLVQDLQPAGQPDGDIDALLRGQPAPMGKPLHFVLESSRSVNVGVNLAA